MIKKEPTQNALVEDSGALAMNGAEVYIAKFRLGFPCDKLPFAGR